MTLMRYQPWGMMDRLRADLDRMVRDSFSGLDGEQGEMVTTDWVPAVDVREEAGRYVLRADLPGVDPKAIDITMENGVLSISGTREEEHTEESKGFHRVERVSGRFFRRFALPDSADSEAISARSEMGVLEVVIPKQAKLEPRRIKVKA
jgi:HSP20 family protein